MSNLAQFPFNSQPIWQSPERLALPSASLTDWLLNTGSLTERLQSRCRQFSVELLGQQSAQAEPEELRRLGMSQQQVVIREVILRGDQQPWVYARSVLPQSLCQADQQGFGQLGKQPLGKILFNDERFQRQPFELGVLTGPSRLHQYLNLSEDKGLWGRRSVFTFEGQRLSVAEVFLPDSPAGQR